MGARRLRHRRRGEFEGARRPHATVDSALKIVEKLEHRAGKDAAGETGDGVGLMIQVPHKLMVKAASAEGIALGGPRDYGVGMFFFPADAAEAGPGPEDAGDHRVQGGAGLPGLAGCAHPSGGAGPEGPGLYALHLPVLCGPACRLQPVA